MRHRNVRIVSRVAGANGLLCLSLFLVRALNSQPILANGDFESGTERWSLSQQEGARADFSVRESDSPVGGNAARVEILQQGLVQHLQLIHSFETAGLKVGEAYELRFWARGEKPTVFLVRLFNRDRPWHSLGLAGKAELSDQWQQFRFPFRVRETPQPFSKVDFFLGQSEGVVWIDGVQIEPFRRQPLTGNVTIETTTWSAQFTQRGAFARLVHKPSQQVLITGAEEDPIYELTLLGEAGKRTVIDRDARRVTLAKDLPNAKEFRFDHGQLRVRLIIERSDDDLLTFKVETENGTDEAITAIRYPILRAPIQLGEASEDDVILLPAYDGGIVENPKQSVPAKGGDFQATYPGPLSCQVFAYYDKTAGLYMGTHDAEGYPKRMRLLTDVDFTFSFQHLSPRLPGEDVRLAYPVVVGTFVGDWYDAARIYRKWSRKQSWCATPLTAPGKTPQWLTQGALVTSFDPRNYRDLERLRAHLARFRELYSALLIANTRGWERWDVWTGQEYLPPQPSEQHFSDVAQLIRQVGGRGMIMLSGYRWTIEKKQPDGSVYSSEERFQREVQPHVVYDILGQKPIIQTSTREKDWHGQRWAMLCRATDFAKQTVVDISRYCVAHGYPVIHFDQEVSGNYEAGVCGSRSHGHPPGDGRWVHLALTDLYRRIRETCEPLDPDFVLSMEEPNELYLPYLNLCQCRPFGLTTEWPAIGPMTRTVPLFSFLYHDYLIQWAAFYPWRSGGHPEYSAAKGFAAGLMPGLHPYDYTLPPDQPTQYSTFFAHCMEAYLGFAHEYLVFGKMLKPLPLDVPTRTFTFRKGGETTVPAVFHSVWKLEDGRIGIVLINPEAEAHEVALDLSTLPLKPDTRMAVRTRDGAEKQLDAKPQVTIDPLDVTLVEISPAQQ